MNPSYLIFQVRSSLHREVLPQVPASRREPRLAAEVGRLHRVRVRNQVRFFLFKDNLSAFLENSLLLLFITSGSHLASSLFFYVEVGRGWFKNPFPNTL